MKKIMLTAAILMGTTMAMAGNKEAKPYQDATAKISKMFKEAQKLGCACDRECYRFGCYCLCP